ncbi:RNA-binding KH domain-containing protein PEPPER-like isoform X4 [Asparagus officinalis]|uniref:RNA-binding KH domain-containing protein PEPPER-like isoform X4 n=1 Tax=Asparagus officinalis TaxID=4686 RepID=UPI00098E453F|nr:RNA-binding KH domain-containing protein PEPPER-like isoform X4 [Asparagus officinalis]
MKQQLQNVSLANDTSCEYCGHLGPSIDHIHFTCSELGFCGLNLHTTWCCMLKPQPNAPLVQAQAPVAAPWSDQAPSLIHTAQQSGMGGDYSFPLKRASLYLEHDSHLDSQIQRSGALSSFYRQEPPLSGLHSTGLGRSAAALVTQVAQTMQIPISYAEDIIGIGGANIAYIRRTSGAVLTAQESGGLHDEITVEIKGSSSQVQAAQQLIQDFMSDIKLDIKIQSDYSTHSDIKW